MSERKFKVGDRVKFVSGTVGAADFGVSQEQFDKNPKTGTIIENYAGLYLLYDEYFVSMDVEFEAETYKPDLFLDLMSGFEIMNEDQIELVTQ